MKKIDENSIAFCVKLRNNKIHSGTVEWGGKCKYICSQLHQFEVLCKKCSH